jgi:hypothetical protein
VTTTPFGRLGEPTCRSIRRRGARYVQAGRSSGRLSGRVSSTPSEFEHRDNPAVSDHSGDLRILAASSEGPLRRCLPRAQSRPWTTCVPRP